MVMEKDKDVQELEAFVDRVGMNRTLEVLAILCNEKSIQLGTNWQDKDSAKFWSKVGMKLDQLSILFEKV